VNLLFTSVSIPPSVKFLGQFVCCQLDTVFGNDGFRKVLKYLGEVFQRGIWPAPEIPLYRKAERISLIPSKPGIVSLIQAQIYI